MLGRHLLAIAKMLFYQAYGLNIASELEFPELIAGGKGEDVCIVKGKITHPKLEPTSIKRQGIEALFCGNKQEAYLQWPGVVTILAVGGTRLTVQPDCKGNPPVVAPNRSNPTAVAPVGEGAVDRQLLNLYILSEALGLILYQKGLFLLHASAVKIGEEVTVFVGIPGAGKSTTVAAFAKKGHQVLADDMVAISLDSHPQPVILPAFPQIKIWPSAVDGIGCDPSSLSPLFPGSRKQVIQQRENFPLTPLSVNRIFLLETVSAGAGSPENLMAQQRVAINPPPEDNVRLSSELKIAKMEPREAFLMLTRFFPCPSAILKGAALQHHFQQCANLLSRVELWKWQRPQNFKMLNTFVAAIEQGII